MKTGKKSHKLALLIGACIVAAAFFWIGRNSHKLQDGWKEAPAPAMDNMSADSMNQASQSASKAGNKNAASKGATANNSGDRKILYWRAPMNPQYTSDKPGKSPMGMDLVPVYADEANANTIKISPDVMQNIGVTTANATRGPLYRSIRTYGTTTWAEDTMATINTKVGGWIEKLDVNETGQVVQKGDPLLSIYSPELVDAETNLWNAIDALKRSAGTHNAEFTKTQQRVVDAARQRLKLWDLSDSQIDALAKTRKFQKTITLYAPISGIVTHRAVVLGDKIAPGTNLMMIAALNPIWIYAAIYEEEIPLVKKGMKATITFDTFPGETFQGTVDYVYPYLEGKQRTGKVRIKLDNKDGRLYPHMYGTVDIKTMVSPDTVQIPDDAVIRSSSTNNVVFLAEAGGHFTARKVVLGPTGDNHMVMIKGGVQGGDKVVTSAQFLLDSESQLRAAAQEMSASKRAG